MESIEYLKHVSSPINWQELHIRWGHLQKFPNLQTERRGRTKKAKDRWQEHHLSPKEIPGKVWRSLRFHPSFLRSEGWPEGHCSFLSESGWIPETLLDQEPEEFGMLSANKPQRQYFEGDAYSWRASLVHGGAQERRDHTCGAMLHNQI